MTGHAYPRALRVHLLSLIAVMSILLQTSECLKCVNLSHFKVVHQSVMKGECSTSFLKNEECVDKVTKIMDDLMEKVATQCRTSKL